MGRRVAVLAISVLGLLGVAGSAQASHWAAATYPATVTTMNNPNNTHVWSFSGVNVTCTGTQTHSVLGSASSTLTFTVNFANCTGSFTVSFDFTPCDFEAHLGATGSGGYKTGLDLVCGTSWINFRFGTCEVNVPSQTGPGAAVAGNVGESEGFDVLLEVAVSNMAYEVTQDGFLCPLSGTGQKTNGTYIGDYEFFGESSNGSRIRISATD